MDGSAEWSASGPENRANLKVRGSIPQPSANFLFDRGSTGSTRVSSKPRTFEAG